MWGCSFAPLELFRGRFTLPRGLRNGLTKESRDQESGCDCRVLPPASCRPLPRADRVCPEVRRTAEGALVLQAARTPGGGLLLQQVAPQLKPALTPRAYWELNGLGPLQGLANVAQSIQNVVVGGLNLLIAATRKQDPVLVMLTPDGLAIPSPDRARGLFLRESDWVHNTSTGMAGEAVMILVTVGAGEILAPARATQAVDPLVDNNILVWMYEGKSSALEFADVYRGQLSINRTVAKEFLRGGRSTAELRGLMQQHDIRLISSATTADTQALMSEVGRTAMKPDLVIVATARKHGIRLATGDYTVMNAARQAGVDVRVWRLTDDGTVARFYQRVIGRLRSQSVPNPEQYLGPTNPWVP
jgi:rRNA-processing protein FCF1